MAEEQLILVNENNRATGAGGKTPVHRAGVLHRAFSIFIVDGAGRILLQRRAEGKYHSGGLLANSCCGHPRPGETTGNAAARRLPEEMGFSCELREAFQMVYRTDLDNALVEHELDRVFVGRFNGVPKPNPQEVDATMWVAPEELRSRMGAEPKRYTPWLRLLLGDAGWAAVEDILAQG